EFNLGELHFAVLLADEEAKANLNVILRSTPDGAQAVAAVLEQTTTGVDGLAVKTPPAAPGISTRSTILRSWGQLFEATDNCSPGAFAVRLRDATRNITCWGTGRLNLRRASDEAVRFVCQNRVTSDILGKLLARRRDAGVTSLSTLLNQL